MTPKNWNCIPVFTRFFKGHLLPKMCFTPRHSLTGDLALLSCYGKHCHIIIHCRALPRRAQLHAFSNLAVHGEGEQCCTNAIQTMIRVLLENIYNRIEGGFEVQLLYCLHFHYNIFPLHNILMCNVNLSLVHNMTQVVARPNDATRCVAMSCDCHSE